MNSTNQSFNTLAQSNTKMQNIRVDKICCIGAGYVGGPTMAMIAYKCPNLEVYVCDKNVKRIQEWNSDTSPIYEPGLSEILKKTLNVNLFFTHEIDKVIKECDIIFISVNTPTKTYGKNKGEALDLSMMEDCCRTISKFSETSKVVIEKSTVPVKTSESLLEVLYSCRTRKDVEFTVISNPEFLAEGTAISDLEFPDRVLIGGRTDSEIGKIGMEILKMIYLNWIPEEKILMMNVWSAELAKLASNAFLAQRISSINSFSRLCEVTGADISQISQAVGSDKRIGSQFLTSSIGFGGSCFKKDILCLAYLFDHFNLKNEAEYWRQVIHLNEVQKTSFSAKIVKSMFNSLNNKKIAVLGFSFKKNTSDVRETPSGTICFELLREGANITIFDPQSKKSEMISELSKYGIRYMSYQNIQQNEVTVDLEQTEQEIVSNYLSHNNIQISSELETAVQGSHALVFCTDWKTFKEINFQQAFNNMEKPAFIFDGRNFLHHHQLFEIGFNVFPIGMPALIHSNSQVNSKLQSSFPQIETAYLKVHANNGITRDAAKLENCMYENRALNY
ncbi:UDP-glucose 6-dehydrogenase [Cryptosporidium sp. chipmunk genotype I]|uniref:UDP-glucose 6-dehydrogenase n=1 Tax=Cryptosporidium sp. chipmunk genotype I TaxID=1280935 RepID=UPI00351A2ABF|nr:UDP-glucose 6-dehydrogenase [Cryptosporidium sp. chipmunk genotype I]